MDYSNVPWTLEKWPDRIVIIWPAGALVILDHANPVAHTTGYMMAPLRGSIQPSPITGY